MLKYTNHDSGEPNTLEYRRFLLDEEGERISYWHDVALRSPSGGFNAIIEITRKTRAKMEISTIEAGTPIKQDVKKGKLRDYNIPIEWNYGAFPQTWEQPSHVWLGLEGHAGDNDPVDVVDLSAIDVPCGTVIAVKPIAALAMIDEGEVDWKVICINLQDPLAALINSLEDCERLLPGQIDAVREWFTWYKAVGEDGARLPDKEPNIFGFEGMPLPTEKALEVIKEAHNTWAALVLRKVPACDLQLC